MRTIASLLLGALVSTAQARESEAERYLVARDDAIAALQRECAESDEACFADEHGKRLTTLARMLRALVGDVSIDGFTATDEGNLDTLVEGELGFGELDAVVFADASGDARVYVTDRAVAENWLRTQANAGEAASSEDAVPDTLEAALRTEAFYTRAISSDASVARFATIPVRSDVDIAYAMLVQRRQDIGPGVPDELVVARADASHVFIATQPLPAKLPAMPRCETVWRGFETRAQRALAAYRASGLSDAARLEESQQLENQGDVEFRRCFAQFAPRERYFPAVAAQAQALLEKLRGP